MNASITSFAEADKFLMAGRNKDSRKVANNTYLERRDPDTRRVKLHNTDVVIYHANGDIELNTGGWLTVTTKDRLNAFTPDTLRIYSKRGKTGSRWVVGLFMLGEVVNTYASDTEVPYVDGIRLRMTDYRWEVVGGNVPDAAALDKADAANAKINRKITKYANLYTDEKLTELVERALANGMGGDCWFCSMKTDDGVPLGDVSGDTDHLTEHMKDGYVMLSLALNAMVANGNFTAEQAQRFIQLPHMSYRVRESVRAYLRNRLYTEGVVTKNGRRPAVPADELHRVGY